MSYVFKDIERSTYFLSLSLACQLLLTGSVSKLIAILIEMGERERKEGGNFGVQPLRHKMFIFTEKYS